MTVVDNSAMHEDATRESGRRAHRAHYFAEVDVLRSGTPKPLKLWGENLSEGGIFLQTNQPWLIGEKLALRIPVEEERVVIRQAEVAWVRPFEPINVDGRMAGIGVRFLSIDPPYRAAIRQVTSAAQNAVARAAEEPRPSGATTPPETARAGAPVLSPLSLPPIAEPEFTLKGWSFAKAPRALDDDERSPQAGPGPSEIGARDEETSRGWRIGTSDRADRAPPAREASRAPAPADTSLPDDGPPAALSIDDDDMAALARADDAYGEAHDDGGSLALSFEDSRPHDLRALSLTPASRGSGIGHSTLEDHVPFTRVVSASERGERGAAETNAAADDRGTFVPRSSSTRGAASFVGGAFVVALGAVCGVFLGLDDAPSSASRAKARVVTEPRSVFEAERGLHALLDDEGAATTGEAAPAPSTKTKPSPTSAAPAARADAPLAPSTEGAEAAVSPPPAATVAAVAPPSAGGAASTGEALLPRKPTAPIEETLTSTRSEAPSAASSTGAPQMKVERGRVTIPFDAKGVKTAFTLAGPPRVVVDLEGAPARAFQEIPIGEKGVTKLRFGRPKPDTVRVVVELDPGASPRDPSTILANGALAIAWR